MKKLFTLSLVCFAIAAQAKNYYIAPTGSNTNDGLTPATAWQTIAKLNTSFNNIAAGDSILFKCGGTYYGSIVVTKSGTGTSPIVISSYGTGNKPVITGLTTLSSWTAVGNGIYQSAAATVKNTVNLVTLNNNPQAVGRYPNADGTNGGYLTYESFSGSSITDNQLTSGTNWMGAEVVIRKQHYSMEKCKIASHSGTVLNYTTTPGINPLNNANPAPITGAAGYGYFIQRDARTLDQLGEWYYNNSTKNMQMYFGSNNPSSYAVKVSTIDTLINIGAKSYITVTNIAFEGANLAAIYAANAGNLNFRSCEMNLMGAKGIFLFNCPNILIDGVNTNNVLCNAFDVTARHQDNVTIRNCNIKNTGMIAGMGSFWDDNDYKAISVTVNSGALVEYNNVENTGFVGIQFQGNNIVVKNNFVNYYDIVKDDGGGIYTYQSGTDAAPGTTYSNRTIKENIVMNGVGASIGTNSPIDVDGIFLDGRSSNVDIVNNTTASIGVNGIYTNNSHDVNVRGNTCFNNGCSIGITKYSWGSLNNVSVKQNIFYPKYNTQNSFSYVNTGVNSPISTTIQSAMQTIGNIDSNYIAVPNPTEFSYYYALNEGGSWVFPKPMSFDGWKSYTNHDKASKLTPKFAPYKLNKLLTTNNVVNGQFTSDIKSMTVWSPASNVTASWDNSTKVNGTGSLKVAPQVSSSDFTFIYGNIGAVSSSKKYILRFTTVGTSASGVLGAFIRKSASPQTILAPAQMASFGTSKITHEFLFTAPATEAAASFLIEIQQASGTTYVDDIEFYEADATVLNIDDQLRFEYNATKDVKTISLGAKYIGVDNTVYDGTITLQPYTSKILLMNGTASTPSTPAPPPATVQNLTANATVPAINCYGDNANTTVSGTGGTAPYTGTGTFAVNAGKGSLKVSVVNPLPRYATLIYGTIGAVAQTKSYVLRFSTVGTTENGSFKVYLRQTASPYTAITPVQSKSFGTARVDHEFIFTAPATQTAASFLIELLQTSGTTYIDNIAFFEATSTGVLTGNNVFSNGQFESNINGITTWSANNAQVAELDLTGKITNTYYYKVTDASNTTAIATVKTSQPSAPLVATSAAADVMTAGGTTTVVISATGGTAPYTGTGNFTNVLAGTYNYTVTDAKGCSSTTRITVKQNSAQRMAAISPAAMSASSLNSIALNGNNELKISSYPNPTHAEFGLTTQGGTNEMIDVTVFSADGRVVFNTSGTSNKRYTFGNSLMPGMYIIKVVQGKTTQTLKVVKAK